MDQLIVKILSGELDAASLLILFIIGILTKRFVPWWIHEEALEKLEQYESTAPALLDEVGELIDLMQTQSGRENITSSQEQQLVETLQPKIQTERQRHQTRRKGQRRKRGAIHDSN